jgi:hypothetical protein
MLASEESSISRVDARLLFINSNAVHSDSNQHMFTFAKNIAQEGAPANASEEDEDLSSLGENHTRREI